MSKRALHKLSARKVAVTGAPGRYGDGGGLYLIIGNAGARKWVFRYTFFGRQRDMGLGSAVDVSLAQARDAAAAARAAVRDGRDPINERVKNRTAQTAVPTFGQYADELVDSIEGGFRNAKHRAQWRMTLREYAKPLRSKPIDQIDTADVLGVLQAIWQTKPETASRLRGRIERVLDAAKARGFRSGENPARWRGHLSSLLAKPQQLTHGHHKALPFDDMPTFMEALRGAEGVAARALEFIILTAARTTEVTGARPGELNLETRVWTVPGDRMKQGREHRVPLPERAVELARQAAAASDTFVFPGGKRNRPLSGTALKKVIRRLGYDVTIHGFRSTFRDWAGERTNFAREVAEAALSHVVGDETERAYRRGDALEKRRALMDAWVAFCARADNVVPLLARA